MDMLKQYTKFIIISLIFGAILTCLIGVFFAYTNVSDTMMGTLVFVGVGLSIFIGSTMLNRKIKKKGYLYGAIFGVTHLLLIYTFSAIAFSGFFINTTVLIYIIMSVMTGAIGGIIGVNI
ncbi:MAG: TIGR04086 family membrane protein [Clostridia bacterium]|nr:TIGR04086 family membrane protein [Clostridia bacterium]MDD4375840.1 TIGR04086 family membrane protein [Clostridia bacterium]